MSVLKQLSYMPTFFRSLLLSSNPYLSLSVQSILAWPAIHSVPGRCRPMPTTMRPHCNAVQARIECSFTPKSLIYIAYPRGWGVWTGRPGWGARDYI